MHSRPIPDVPYVSSTHTVVCVDDEAPVLAAIRRLLRREPYKVHTTTSPDEALRWVKEKEVSLILSDHRMPGMTGIELLRRVRSVSVDTVRVILTGYPDDNLILEGMDDRGVQWLISKPWKDDDLKRTIRRLLFEKELKSNPDLAPDEPSTSILPPAP